MIFSLCRPVVSVGVKSTYSSLVLYYGNNRDSINLFNHFPASYIIQRSVICVLRLSKNNGLQKKHIVPYLKYNIAYFIVAFTHPCWL